MAEATSAEMADSILKLYRSATAVNELWGPGFLDIPRPGLVVVPAEDPFLDGDGARRAAARAGARVETLEGLGHWWMLQDPARAASLYESFWETSS